MNPNTGWLFYKNYYLENAQGSKIEFLKDAENKKNEALFEARNKELFALTIPDLQDISRLPKNRNTHSFRLQTTYPGLLIGSGYNHGTGKQGELKLGFFFDHTTGLPMIPGSSVKGLLRANFPGMDYRRSKLNKKEELASIYDNHAKEKLAYLEYLLEAVGNPIKGMENILKIEWELFAGTAHYQLEVTGNGKIKETGQKIPMSRRDVFHDAFIAGPVGANYVADDYITPHKNTKKDGIPDEMKNPIPISFLKVLPEIQFEFTFDLNDRCWLKEENGNKKEPVFMLTPEQKKNLFQQMLLQQGVGAKTNVGYGQLEAI